MSHIELKKVFLVASSSDERRQFLENFVKTQYVNASLFSASNGTEALFKAENVVPHILLLDTELTKINPFELATDCLRRWDKLAVIIFSPLPDKEHFLDEVVTGRVQFITDAETASNRAVLTRSINKALDWVFLSLSHDYRMRFLNAGDVLLREGEKAEYVYLVKTGTLQATKNKQSDVVVLGLIQPGEFVGEMAYINGESRMADVTCVTSCELIQMPSGSLDAVLFSKPAWSKALLKTLSKRLKKMNNELYEGDG